MKDTAKSLILVGQIPYIGKSCLHWLEAEGLVNRRRRPNCPAGIVLVLYFVVSENSKSSFFYFVTLSVPRYVINFDFVGQIPIVTERLCSVMVCDRFSADMLGDVTTRFQRHTIDDRLLQYTKITVENLDLWTLVLRWRKKFSSETVQ